MNVKGYLEYIEESKTGKNTHLTHLEDLVFEGGGRAAEAVAFLEEIAKMLNGNSKSKTNSTVKWDGAPAIFCGIDPENGKFFVGTKSIFNKTPKINYTMSDVRKNHPGGVADKLKTALRYLKKLPIKGILQGDMMFGPGDIKTKNIDGVMHYTFKPNTIMYAVPVNSDLGNKLKTAKMGIVFHTTYSGKSIQDMTASFNVNVNRLKNTSSVWVDDADFKDISGTATLTSTESTNINAIVSQAKSELKIVKSFMDDLKNQEKIISNLNIYVNSKVKQGTISLSTKEFVTWTNDKIQGEIDGLTSEAAIKKRESARKQMLGYLKNKNKEMDSVFSLHAILTKGKLILLRKMESVKSIGTFIQTSKGLDVTKPEGFVAVDKISNNAVKIVDRLTFSRANFNVAKDWVKG
jgi:hypothetical protein